MTKLALMLATATLMAAQAACVIHTDDRGHGGGGGGGGGGGSVEIATIDARWSLRNMVDGAVTRCPVGFDTVEVLAQAIDADGVPLDDPNVDLFDCATGAGRVTDLLPDVYQVWLEVRSHDRAQLYAQSLSQVIDVRTADQTFSTDVLNDGGYFQLSWDLVGGATRRPLTCAQAGIDGVRATSSSSSRIYEDRRACDDATGISEGLLQGPYTLTIEATAAGTTHGSLVLPTTVTIAGQNRITDVGTVSIPVVGL